MHLGLTGAKIKVVQVIGGHPVYIFYHLDPVNKKNNFCLKKNVGRIIVYKC